MRGQTRRGCAERPRVRPSSGSDAAAHRHRSPHTPSKRVLDGVGWAFGWGRMGAQSPSKPIQNRFGWGLDGPSGHFWMGVSGTWHSPEVRP